MNIRGRVSKIHICCKVVCPNKAKVASMIVRRETDSLTSGFGKASVSMSRPVQSMREGSAGFMVSSSQEDCNPSHMVLS